MTNNQIALTPVESSQIHSIGHDAASNTLAIRFKNSKGEPGSLYHYDNFTADDFAAFQGAESIGSHFGKHIKNAATKYPFEKIDETANAAPVGTTTLRFEGNSDDTFGEYAATNDDYDNCASGKPIEWVVTSPSSPGVGLVVTGQHCPGESGSWLVGIASYDPEFNDNAMPAWPARFVPDQRRAAGQRNPVLEVDVPADFILICLQRDGVEA
jgi:hypothetical protein